MLVFFDVLHLNGQDLLDTPYGERRAILERIITSVPGYSMVAQRTQIKTPEMSWDQAEDRLNECFASCIATSEGKEAWSIGQAPSPTANA